jgi:hypothetical protein
MSFESLIEKAVAKTGEPIKLKRRNAQPEAIEQAKVIAWAKRHEHIYPYLWLLHCSLNGVKLSAIQASIAKAQGMLSGVPDLFLPVPKNGYHGLYIEMKSAKGRVSVEQSRYLKCAAENGYSVVVCYSANEAIKRIEDYYQ